MFAERCGKISMADASPDNPRALSAATAVPPHHVTQGEIKEPAWGEQGISALGPASLRARLLPMSVMSVALLRRLRSVGEVY